MSHDLSEEERRALFVESVCRYLGQDNAIIRDQAAKIYGHEAVNPKWGAVVLMRNMLGPGHEDQVKEFALKLGFCC